MEEVSAAYWAEYMALIWMAEMQRHVNLNVSVCAKRQQPWLETKANAEIPYKAISVANYFQ